MAVLLRRDSFGVESLNYESCSIFKVLICVFFVVRFSNFEGKYSQRFNGGAGPCWLVLVLFHRYWTSFEEGKRFF